MAREPAANGSDGDEVADEHAPDGNAVERRLAREEQSPDDLVDVMLELK
jgi:hypothetical protein